MNAKVKAKWMREFREDSPVSYGEAMRLAANPDLRVEIVHTNETGEWRWAIDAVSHAPGFWMDSRPTKKAAIQLCRDMGWKRLASVRVRVKQDISNRDSLGLADV
jgi:hypothetical protein